MSKIAYGDYGERDADPTWWATHIPDEIAAAPRTIPELWEYASEVANDYGYHQDTAVREAIWEAIVTSVNPAWNVGLTEQDNLLRQMGSRKTAADIATDGACGLSWDDSIVTSMTPAPSARCPFEQFHEYDEDGEPYELEPDDIPDNWPVQPVTASRSAYRVVDKQGLPVTGTFRSEDDAIAAMYRLSGLQDMTLKVEKVAYSDYDATNAELVQEALSAYKSGDSMTLTRLLGTLEGRGFLYARRIHEAILAGDTDEAHHLLTEMAESVGLKWTSVRKQAGNPCDRCGRTDVWTEVRNGWDLLCDACAARGGWTYSDPKFVAPDGSPAKKAEKEGRKRATKVEVTKAERDLPVGSKGEIVSGPGDSGIYKVDFGNGKIRYLTKDQFREARKRAGVNDPCAECGQPQQASIHRRSEYDLFDHDFVDPGKTAKTAGRYSLTALGDGQWEVYSSDGSVIGEVRAENPSDPTGVTVARPWSADGQGGSSVFGTRGDAVEYLLAMYSQRGAKRKTAIDPSGRYTMTALKDFLKTAIRDISDATLEKISDGSGYRVFFRGDAAHEMSLALERGLWDRGFPNVRIAQYSDRTMVEVKV